MRWNFARCGLFIFAGIWLTGCGPSVNVTFDPSVPSDQQTILRQDHNRIQSLSFAAVAPSEIQIMGTRDLTASTLVDWLNKRVNLIVGENFDYQSAASLTQVAGSPSVVAASDNVQTLMWNLGTYLYLDGKPKNEIYTLRTATGNVRINTPAVGIIAIGPGLFDPDQMIPGSAMTSKANSFIRIPVEFHEGAHDLGSGTDNAGFPHALCTSGTYANDYACEAHLNGPYAKQAMLGRQLYSMCGDCTSAEKAALALVAADYQSRLLPNAVYTSESIEIYQ